MDEKDSGQPLGVAGVRFYVASRAQIGRDALARNVLACAVSGTVTVDCGEGRHFRIESRGHNIEN